MAKTRRRHKRSSYCRGEDNPQAKLTDDRVRKIRHDHSLGISQRNLAQEHGVSTRAIRFVVTGVGWKHI